jgi:hypothetical protein
MTITDMKIYLLAHLKPQQRGPDDYAGYERDSKAASEIMRASTWAQLEQAAPAGYAAAVANRCTVEQL